MSLAAVPIARAEPPPTPASNPSEEDLARARELFDNGKSLYLDGSYDPAIAAFKQAYALSGDPLLLYNIAQAHDRAAQYDGAIEYFEYYRAFAPANERAALEEKVESLRRRKIKAQSEEPTEASPTPVDGDESGPADDEIEPLSDDGTGDDTATDSSDIRVFSPAAIALTAVAVVGFGTGAGLGVASRRRTGDVNDQCADSPLLCPAGAEADLDASRRFALGADIAFGIGAAAAVGAVVIIAINATRRSKGQAAAGPSRFRVAGHRRGASLQVRF